MAELTEAQRIALFKEGDGLLRGTLAYKSGCSLAEDDHRPDNQQAIDLYYETRARLWETLGHLDTHELERAHDVATRLVGRWSHLERQQGGIGTRGGPGEAQIELDRRMIGERIKTVKARLVTD